MAERRMMAIRVIDEDAFLDLPSGARLLYYDLSMRADDDGFITPKKVMRLIGASQKDLDALIEAGFLISFESGVVAITHWRANNTIRKDRYNPTVYQEEFSQLAVNNGKYERYTNDERQPMVAEESEEDSESDNQVATNGKPDGNQMETDGCQSDNRNGNQMATKRQPMVATGKDRLGEEKGFALLSESSSQREAPQHGNQVATIFTPPTLEEVRTYFGSNCLKGNPDTFWSTYAAVGWIDGLGRDVKDWHALARKWSGKENLKPDGSRPRDYDGAYDGHRMKEVSI